ncbi:hypothetical protein QQS21_005472 [Conoideocrella luteorostrata]|uniref:Protein kinase domain-containing protein n=1 Tax=Conoideocrella luteorostrata TaxID=1105319 RepID=A0AAJ0CS62_9HYPO|nr:hypothetical protein QQS21_005472 [Conoideocrella luteorostrata]
MTGLRWTYSDLMSYFGRTGKDHVNPIIEQLLRACPSSSVFGLGGHSVVLELSPTIVAKVSTRAGDSRLQNEQKIFELLQQSQCHHIVQCFFRGTDVSFLECLADGTLHDRISIQKPRPILQWMFQVSAAAACLEELGYAHGDINPQNILVDRNDELKLIDFDHSLEIGADLDVGYEPYVRQFWKPVGGVFGAAGPQTEQLALGSVFWYMLRGTELYSELDGPDQVDRLRDGVFPVVNSSDPVEKIIENCWYGRYDRVSDLVVEIKDMVGSTTTEQRGNVVGNETVEKTRNCENYYNSILSG